MKHYAFPKIRQYHQVLRGLKLAHQYVGKDEAGDPIYDSNIKLPVVEFVGYTKLHGSNGAVVFKPDGTFYCQSRSNIIDEVKDNAGFAHWVNIEGKDIFNQIQDHFLDNTVDLVVVFGEWCGGSIQKGVALNELTKRFVVFGVKLIKGEETEWVDSSYIQDHTINVFNISEAPSYHIGVDLERPDKAIEDMVAMATGIGDECPFAKLFGVSGIGEGVVFREAGQHSFGNAFKVKDSRYSKSKIKKPPTVDVVKMDNIQQAVETHCHEDRMEQIWDKIVLTEVDKDPKNIGLFVREVLNDVWVEEGDALRASDISRKEMGKAISKIGARWFQDKLKDI